MSFGNYTYKNKMLMLYSVTILVWIIVFNYVFTDTFNIYRERNNSLEKIATLKEQEKMLPEIKAQLNDYAKFASNDLSKIRADLSTYISAQASRNNCAVTEIPESILNQAESNRLENNIFTITGNFINLTKLLKDIEQYVYYKAGIVSVKYYSTYEYTTKRNKLFLKIFTQSVSINEADNKNENSNDLK